MLKIFWKQIIIAFLIAVPFISKGADFGKSLKFKITAKKSQQSGIWAPIDKNEQKAERYIEAKASGIIFIDGYTKIVGDLSVMLESQYKSSELVWGNFILSPAFNSHAAKLYGKYTVPGDVHGELPDWSAKGSDGCNYEKVTVLREAGNDIDKFVKWDHNKTIKKYRFSVTPTIDKIFSQVRDAAAFEIILRNRRVKVWGFFDKKYTNKIDCPEGHYETGTYSCPKCKEDTLYKYIIKPKFIFTAESYEKIAYWNEFYAGGKSGPGPEARCAWREFREHIEWHEDQHKSNFKKEIIDKVKAFVVENFPTKIIGEACENKEKARDIAKKKREDELRNFYDTFNKFVSKCKAECDRLDDAFDDSEKNVTPGEGEASLRTLGPPVLEIAVPEQYPRWEEPIGNISVEKIDKGYNFYDYTKEFSLVNAPSWLTIDSHTGKLSGKPVSKNKKIVYLTDKKIKFKVKLEETLDGEKIVGTKKCSLHVRNWNPVISVLQLTGKDCKFGIVEGTGIPDLCTPKNKWTREVVGMGAKIQGNRKGKTVKIKITTKKLVPGVDPKKNRTLRVYINQKAKGVKVSADEDFDFRKIKKK